MSAPADAAAPRVQARIPLPESARAAIDAARLHWNPEIARGNPAHLTIAYADEAPDPALLEARVAAACRAVAPFPLELGATERFAAPAQGAFLAVSDPRGGVARLRRRLLAPPFTTRSRFGLHVTLLHPAHGFRLEEAWPALSSLARPAAFVAERVELITGVGPGTRVLASFTLAGPSEPAAP